MRQMLAVLAALSAAAGLCADDKELTPLRPLQMPTPMPMPAQRNEDMTYLRTSYMARWQYYGVDQQGYFRPRVVLDFPDPYYLVNGRCYPLLPVMPRNYITHILD